MLNAACVVLYIVMFVFIQLNMSRLGDLIIQSMFPTLWTLTIPVTFRLPVLFSVFLANYIYKNKCLQNVQDFSRKL